MKDYGLAPITSSRDLWGSRNWNRDTFLWWRKELAGFLKELDVVNEAIFYPNVNVTELKDRFEITAELPGVDKSELDITLTGGGLKIQGEKKLEFEKDNGNYYVRDRRQGSFQRFIRIPAEFIDSEQVEANLNNGILRITIPKRKELQLISKKIEVKTK